MREPLVLNPHDNIAVLTERAPAGSDPLEVGAALANSLSSGHKIARSPIQTGDAILKFGQFIGKASANIAVGEHVHTQNCIFSTPHRQYSVGADLAAAKRNIPNNEVLTFEGYARSDGRVGTRNYIALVATVNCSATVIRLAAREIEASKILDDYTNIDGIASFAHGTGCGMANHGRGNDILDRVLWGHAIHPNVGAVIFVGLGCEVMQIARMQSHYGDTGSDRFHALTIQASGGTRATIEAIKTHVSGILSGVNANARTAQPMSSLIVALQCGGSDGFSSITANPALGAASDLIVGQGGTAILSETPEIFGAEQLLLGRAKNKEVADKLLQQVQWWEGYVSQSGGSMDNNPSPGNKQGGITTILEKSLGAVAKCGSTPLQAVYDYAEQVSEPGFVFMDTPGYDPVSATGQIAGGAQIVVFTTGRGSAFGSKPAPTIKLATNNRLFDQMPDDMDLNCGDIVSDGVAIAAKGLEIFNLIRSTASGETTKSERLGLGDNEFVPWQIGAVM